MKKVLFLGAPVFQIPVVKKAKSMGLYVGIVDIDQKAPAFPYADECFIASLRDEEAVLKIAEEFKPDGIIIGACDTSVVTGAYVCYKMHLPGNTLEAAYKSTNKLKMIEAFEANNVDHPKYQLIKKSETDSFRLEIPYPIICKPTDSSGGRGIHLVHNDDELYEAAAYSSQAGLSGDILVEEYMTGPEVSVEVLVIDGVPHVIQITDKITSGAPNFFEIGHSQPSQLKDEDQERIRKLAKKAVLAVGLYNSPAHVEIKLTPEGPKMVELGARMGGGCITTYLLETSVSGINMSEATIMLSLGQKPDTSKYKNSGTCAGIRFIPAVEGTIDSISGVDDASKADGVIKVEIMSIIGKKYFKAKDNTDRLGYVVSKGTTTREALFRCQKAIDRIKINIK